MNRAADLLIQSMQREVHGAGLKHGHKQFCISYIVTTGVRLVSAGVGEWNHIVSM